MKVEVKRDGGINRLVVLEGVPYYTNQGKLILRVADFEVEELWKLIRQEVCPHKNKKPSNQFDPELGFIDCADCGKDLG